MKLNKLQIYALKNSEILTQHEIKINKFDSISGDDEYDPIELWNAIQDVRRFLLIFQHKNISMISFFQGPSNRHFQFENPRN